MASDIEAKPLVLDGSREATDIPRISFEDFRPVAIARELVAGGQAGRTCADDHHPMMVDVI
jgi:hypothetical protein